MNSENPRFRAFGAVHAADPQRELFVVPPATSGGRGRVAFGFLLAPVAGNDPKTEEKLRLLHRMEWPDGTGIQTTLSASPDLTAVLSRFAAKRQGASSDLLRASAAERQAFLRKAVDQPLREVGALLREVQVALSFSVPYEGLLPSDDFMDNLATLRNGVEELLKGAKIGSVRINADRYLRFMESMLNPGEDAAWRRSTSTTADDSVLLCDQVLDPGHAIESDEDGLWLEGRHRVTLLSPKHYPKRGFFGLAMRYLADWTKGDRGLPENVVITLNTLIPNQQKAKGAAESAKNAALHFSENSLAKFIKSYGQRRDAWKAITDHYDDGDAAVRGYLNVALITRGASSSEEARRETVVKANRQVTNAIAYFQEIGGAGGFQMMRDRYIVLPLFAQMMPMAIDPDLDILVSRYRTWSARIAVGLMPLMASWRGTGNPLMSLMTRDGQLMGVDVRETDTNQNFLLVGASGGGKSFLSNHLVENWLAEGGRATLIDAGNSYRTTCSMLGGQYLSFGKGSTISVNPFTHIADFKDDAELIGEILQVMAAPRDGLTDYEFAGLKRITADVFATKGNATQIDDIEAACLQSTDPAMVRIGRQLFSFTSRGEHGSWFAGPSTLDLSNPLTVLELDDLQSKPTLQRVILMILISQTEQAIYRGNREQWNLVLIDEAWQLLARDDTSPFIQAAYRKFRKYKACIGIVAQNIGVIWDSAGGRAITSNSATKIFVPQNREELDAIAAEGRASIGEYGMLLAKSLQTTPGQFSEVLWQTDRGMGVGRLVVSDFHKLQYSSTPDEVAALQKLQAQGLPAGDAIRQLAGRRAAGRRAA